MNDYYHYTRPGDPDISVALAGKSKLDWVYAEANDSREVAFQKMLVNRFDVLPIREVNGEYQRYYITKDWGTYVKEDIEIKFITPEDRLYYLTNIHDAIANFSVTRRQFFFLDNLLAINGLITIGNLNSKHIYLYLYNLIVQVEHALEIYLSSGHKRSRFNSFI